jgi:peroxiredoxin
MLRCTVALVVLVMAIVIEGGELAPVRVGVSKASWENLPGVDGQNHSLSDLAEKKLVVVVITCNHCPIAMEYFQRLKEFSEKFCGPESDVALVAISLSSMETDKLDRMKELAKRESFNFPYLRDESQAIGKQLGATVTPQFFILNESRTLVFRGPWDDQVNSSKVKFRYVEDAVNALRIGNAGPSRALCRQPIGRFASALLSLQQCGREKRAILRWTLLKTTLRGSCNLFRPASHGCQPVPPLALSNL